MSSWAATWRVSTERPIVSALALGLTVLLFDATMALAFPPYKLTDADTAEPLTIEARLGLVQYQVERDKESYSSPLVRLNLGLTAHTEILAEAEYSQETDRVEEAAVGGKWIPWPGSLAFGAEVLTLLPRSGESDYGVEATLLMTVREASLLTHANLGAIEDRRPSEHESGWKGGVLLEWLQAQWRPGVELFAKQLNSEPEQASAGIGAIFPFDSLDVRIGVRAGLTNAAPDLTASIWISGNFPLSGQ